MYKYVTYLLTKMVMQLLWLLLQVNSLKLVTVFDGRDSTILWNAVWVRNHTEVRSTDSRDLPITTYSSLRHPRQWHLQLTVDKKCTCACYCPKFSIEGVNKIYMCGAYNLHTSTQTSLPYPSMLLTNFEYHSGCNGPDRITRRTGIQPTITWRGLTKFPCFSGM